MDIHGHTTPNELTTVMLKNMVAAEADNLRKFQGSLANDPVYALQWADSAFRAAGRQKIAQTVLNQAELLVAEGKPLEVAYTQIAARLIREVVSEARSPASSSSQAANLMDNYLKAAKADVLELLGSYTT